MASFIYTFDGFCVDSPKRKLLLNGADIKLGDNEYDLLLYLIENRPSVCALDKIREDVWVDANVENNSVEKAIVAIRKALGDDAKAPTYIKNRRGLGYSFIGDVAEIDTFRRSVEEAEHIVEAQSHQTASHKQARNSSLIIYSALVFAVTIAFLASLGIVYSKGSGVFSMITQSNILTDSFSSKDLNRDLWIVSGNGISVVDGIVKVGCWETDNCGRLASKFTSFDPTKALTIEGRIKVQPSPDLKDKQFFLSFFGLVPKNADIDDMNTRDHSVFGVYFVDYAFESRYPNGELDEFPAEGWFLFRNGGSPQKKIDHLDGKIGKRIPPLWDTWFEQKITYDPKDGTLSLFINEKLFDVFQVGDLYSNIDENKIRVEVAPRGWWLNHSIEVDEIRVYQ